MNSIQSFFPRLGNQFDFFRRKTKNQPMLTRMFLNRLYLHKRDRYSGGFRSISRHVFDVRSVKSDIMEKVLFIFSLRRIMSFFQQRAFY